MFRAIPPALIVGAFVSVLGRGAQIFEPSIRWWLFCVGAAFLEVALLSAGAFELARRSRGAARTQAALAGAIYAGVTTWVIVAEMSQLALGDRAARSELYTWLYRAGGLGIVAAAALLATAVGGWRRTPIAAGFFLVTEFAGAAWPYIADLVGAHWRIVDSLRLFVGAAGAGGMLYMLAMCLQDRAPAIADARSAASGFRIAAKALWWKLAAMIVLFNLGFTVSTSGSLGLYALLLAIGAALIGAAALLRVANSRLEGLPVMRVVVGAAAILWWSRVELLLAWQRSTGHGFLGPADLELWSSGGPVIAGAGILLIGSALVAFADAQPNPRLSKSAMNRTIAYGATLAFAFSVQPMWVPRSLDELHAMTSVIALPAMATLFLFAGLLARVADQLAAGPQLPPARAVST